MALGFHTDAALTTPVSGNLQAPQKTDGSTDPVVFELWLGDPDTGYDYEADSDPGTDQITVSISDSAPGTGHATTEVKLATTVAGLASATAGASLNIGVTLVSGSANAQKICIEVDDATATVGTSTELSVGTNLLQKTAS